MADRLTMARLMELIDAYGADPSRWPPAERSAATRLLEDPAYAARLAEARVLDTALDRWTVKPPSAALRAAVLPATALRRARDRVGWAAAGLAAAASGILIVQVAVPMDQPGWHRVEDTAFGDVPGKEAAR